MDLDLELIRQGIRPGRLIFFETIDSTNSYALDHAGEFHPGTKSLILAEKQTHGRGRGDKPWVSTPEALLFTLVVHSDHPDRLKSIGMLSLMVAQTLAECIECELETSGHRVQIKWPNDLILDGRKLGGILIEAKSGGGGHCVCIGIGLNINATPADTVSVIVDASKQLPATSLAESSGRSHDRTRLLTRIVQKLFTMIDTWQLGATLQSGEIDRRLYGRRQRGRVVSGDSETSGILFGVDPSGGLLIDTGEQICRVVSGTLEVA